MKSLCFCETDVVGTQIPLDPVTASSCTPQLLGACDSHRRPPWSYRGHLAYRFTLPLGSPSPWPVQEKCESPASLPWAETNSEAELPLQCSRWDQAETTPCKTEITLELGFSFPVDLPWEHFCDKPLAQESLIWNPFLSQISTSLGKNISIKIFFWSYQGCSRIYFYIQVSYDIHWS